MAGIPMSEVKKHNSKDSAWVVLHGEVYDLTLFASEHPGGVSVVLKSAGKDVTAFWSSIHKKEWIPNYLKPEQCLGPLGPEPAVSSPPQAPKVVVNSAPASTAVTPPAPATAAPAPPAPTVKAKGTGDPTTYQEFFKVNKYFAVPWIIFMTVLYSTQYMPFMQAYYARHGMETYGLWPATKLMVYSILMAYAMHGWITVNHDELVKKGLKILPNVPYNFQCGDASTRATLVFFFGMMTYAFVPMRPLAATWGGSVMEFLVGYLILLIGGDAWFFCVHYMAHTPTFYRLIHKTHHKWKHPVPFSAYFITSFSHALQEHAFCVPAMMFLPVPWTAFWFYQYYGIPASLLQHCAFDLSSLNVPFCGPLKIGHIESACGLFLGKILGSQSTASHDYHHETFMGNFQLSYTYLDRLFGLYVDTSKTSDAQEPLLSA